MTAVQDSFNLANNDQADKETNTECVFLLPSGAPPWLSTGGNRRGLAGKGTTIATTAVASSTGDSQSVASASVASALVKRSQTFSPSAPINKSDYVCKVSSAILTARIQATGNGLFFQLNRSDSDSAMSLHNKRLAFQRSMLERRSLRVPATVGAKSSATSGRHSSSSSTGGAKPKSSKGSKNGPQTPLDLELDLAAQQTKLQLLQDEIDRLKEIKVRLEEARKQGAKEIPPWLQEQEGFQQMLSKVKTL